MQKKGAISLSMNFLVIIIISLVIFGMGISLLYKLLGSAENVKKDLDARTEQELDRLLIDQGQKVALPLHVATVERGKTHIFGLGIRNIGDAGDQFRIVIELVAVAEDDKDITTEIAAEEVAIWFLFTAEPLTIQENEHHKEPILVNPARDARRGQYVFKARVLTADGKMYGNPQTFVVNVV